LSDLPERKNKDGFEPEKYYLTDFK